MGGNIVLVHIADYIAAPDEPAYADRGESHDIASASSDSRARDAEFIPKFRGGYERIAWA
jgi:hypothetical protein